MMSDSIKDIDFYEREDGPIVFKEMNNHGIGPFFTIFVILFKHWFLLGVLAWPAGALILAISSFFNSEVEAWFGNEIYSSPYTPIIVLVLSALIILVGLQLLKPTLKQLKDVVQNGFAVSQSYILTYNKYTKLWTEFDPVKFNSFKITRKEIELFKQSPTGQLNDDTEAFGRLKDVSGFSKALQDQFSYKNLNT